MISYRACKLCGSSHALPVKRYAANAGLSEDWRHVFASALKGQERVSVRLLLCLSCGFLFYGDTLDHEELRLLYEEERRYAKPDDHKLKAGRKWELDTMEAFLRRALEKRFPTTVLDVGAGDFVALERTREILPQSDFSAIDPSYDQNEYEGIQVFRNMLEDFPVGERFDLVTAVHVLEHVGDLHAFMSKVAELSAAYFYAEVPFQVGPGLFRAESVNAQHINYFTPATLKKLLSIHGFSTIATSFSRDGYRHNGMPGMIRIFAEKRIQTEHKPATLSTVYHLLNPFLLLKAKMGL